MLPGKKARWCECCMTDESLQKTLIKVWVEGQLPLLHHLRCVHFQSYSRASNFYQFVIPALVFFLL